MIWQICVATFSELIINIMKNVSLRVFFTSILKRQIRRLVSGTFSLGERATLETFDGFALDVNSRLIKGQS